MSWSIVTIPSDVSDLTDPYTAADFNAINDSLSELWDNIQVLGGNGTSAPSTDIETIASDLITLDGRIDGLAGSTSKIDVKQSVLSGAVNASNLPSCLVIGTGLAVTLDATPTPVVLSISSGYTSTGSADSLQYITADKSFSSLTAYANPYLYINSAGTTGHSVYRPIYSRYYTGLKAGALHANFDGSNGATTFSDHYSNPWTFVAGGALSTAQKKYGTASFRVANAGDVIYATCPQLSGKWTMEFWCRMDTVAANTAALLSAYGISTGYGVQLVSSYGGASSPLQLALSSNNSSWDIGVEVGSKTNWSNNTWYHFAIVFTGAAYKVYVDGTLDITITSSTAVWQPDRIQLGGLGPGYGNGDARYFDEFKFWPYAKYTANFTKPAAAHSIDPVFWYDVPGKQMKTGYPGSWAASNSIFMGECITGASSVSAVTTYAYQGEYESDITDYAVNTQYTFAANIGCHDVKVTFYAIVTTSYYGFATGDIIDISGSQYMDSGNSNRGIASSVRGNTVRVSVREPALAEVTAGGAALEAISNKFFIKVKRGF